MKYLGSVCVCVCVFMLKTKQLENLPLVAEHFRQFIINTTSSWVFSWQVCPDKKIHPSALQHLLHFAKSQQESSFVRWESFVPHPLHGFTHTHMVSNTAGRAVPALFPSFSRTTTLISLQSWEYGNSLLWLHHSTLQVQISPKTKGCLVSSIHQKKQNVQEKLWTIMLGGNRFGMKNCLWAKLSRKTGVLFGN